MGRKIISKILLFVLNVVYFLGALALVVIGGMSLAGDDAFLDMLRLISEEIALIENIVDVAAVMIAPAVYFVVLGSLALLLSLIGAFGSLKGHSAILIFYGVAKMCIILFNVALIMYNSIVPYHGKEHIQSLMQDNLQEHFTPIQFNESYHVVLPPEESPAWYWATMELENACCGAMDYTDYADLMLAYNATSTGAEGLNATVSPSCCIQKIQYKIPELKDDFINVTECMIAPVNYVNYKGCIDYVMPIVINYRQIYIIAAAAFIVLEVLTIAFTIRVFDDRRDDYD